MTRHYHWTVSHLEDPEHNRWSVESRRHGSLGAAIQSLSPDMQVDEHNISCSTLGIQISLVLSGDSKAPYNCTVGLLHPTDGGLADDQQIFTYENLAEVKYNLETSILPAIRRRYNLIKDHVLPAYEEILKTLT